MFELAFGLFVDSVKAHGKDNMHAAVFGQMKNTDCDK